MDVSLLSAPGGSAMLPVKLGREVEVLERREPLVRHQGRLDRWYLVRLADAPYIAWVFGGGLTPFCVRGDLDGDGRADDLATVYFDADGLVHVRTRVAGQISSGVIEPGGPTDYRRGGRISDVSLLPASVAGMPLVEMHTDFGGCCIGFVKYLSFGPHDIRRALELTDYFETSDRFSAVEVRFDPKTRTAVVREHSGEKDQHERTIAERTR